MLVEKGYRCAHHHKNDCFLYEILAMEHDSLTKHQAGLQNATSVFEDNISPGTYHYKGNNRGDSLCLLVSSIEQSGWIMLEEGIRLLDLQNEFPLLQ